MLPPLTALTRQVAIQVPADVAQGTEVCKVAQRSPAAQNRKSPLAAAASAERLLPRAASTVRRLLACRQGA